jgi:hypothetical protein
MKYLSKDRLSVKLKSEHAGKFMLMEEKWESISYWSAAAMPI